MRHSSIAAVEPGDVAGSSGDTQSWRLIVHDFAGHPGPVQLSRELARRGHHVQHQFCASVMTGRGATTHRNGDPPSFSIRAISLSREFARYTPILRVWQELQYAQLSVRAIIRLRPDAVILSNVPLLALFFMAFALRMRAIPYLLWWQDVHSEAIRSIARRRLGWLGDLAGWLAVRVERSVAHGAVTVMPITEAFNAQLDAWGIPRSKVHVMPNWGAIDEMPTRSRDNDWARTHGLTRVQVAMYAGTLGLKHDPAAIVDLARAAPPGLQTVVVSQGKGRDWLEANAGEDARLTLLDYQPYEDLPDTLASADVLIVLLERDASRYSVPSKALNYLCVGRPVLALLPPDNVVAQMIESAGAGIVVPPGDREAASAALKRLVGDEELRAKMGSAARRYAESAFDIYAVGDRAESAIRTLQLGPAAA